MTGKERPGPFRNNDNNEEDRFRKGTGPLHFHLRSDDYIIATAAPIAPNTTIRTISPRQEMTIPAMARPLG